MMTNQKAVQSQVQQLDKNLILRAESDHLLLEWTSSCDFHGTEVHRQICEGVDKDSARQWALTLEGEGCSDTVYGGLRLTKCGDEVLITFLRTFLPPCFVSLSQTAQRSLRASLNAVAGLVASLIVLASIVGQQTA